MAIRPRLSLPIVLSAATAAVAQPVQIDPGHTDVSPNAISLRHLSVDLRVPAGFDHVYQFSTMDAFGHSQTMFMRKDGDVTAIFPRSIYISGPGGLIPEIPPGTVFHIGYRPAPIQLRHATHLASNYIDTAIHPEQEAQEQGRWASLPPRSTQSMITDEFFRRRRVAELLNRDPASR
jgi:hypothetical protein